MSEFMRTDTAYKAWIAEIGKRFRQCQLQAAAKVNSEMLRFYWMLGRDIAHKESDNHYGASFYRNLSLDLCKEFPDVKSFSITNLKYMRYFYTLYSNRPQAGDDSETQNIFEDPSLNRIFSIPWGHNKLILDKCRGNQKKALFYVRETIENNWSRAVLMNFLDTDLYERKGKAVSNFRQALPAVGSDLAQEMTRDPYNFDFLTLRENYNEKELKDALMQNVRDFLLELGTGFAFVGREYRLVIGKTEQYIDMLFYNIINHCYVVVEVKVRDFEPADMGQLGTYVAAVDDILRKEGDNQTIGLLICKTKDNVLARYAANASNVPVGISEYQLRNLIPENFRSSMPTIEEIEQELKS